EMAEEGILTQQKLLNEKKKIIARAMAKAASYEYYKELFRQEGRSEQVMSGILKEIEEVASNLDIRIASLKPQRDNETQAYNEYSVSLNITTTFENSVNFLYNLQKRPFMFTVDKFDYDKRSRKGKEITIQLILSKTLIPD
ncbi:MAG: type 4a pilus biogenesis protein PilO, partial [Candidatus Omnitrophica bacterium]|nr:type 4a pilus biogenesis protein PilO [Candidatus Omnitrophota bacterium]